MILGNATILTMDPRMPRMRALAIAGGKVLAGIDSREDPIVAQAHERIDLQGATVVPGFADSHVHFTRWARQRGQLDLRSCTSLAATLDAIRAAATAEGWLLGGGWFEAGWSDGAPTGKALDDAAGGRPVALTSKDGHSLWLNRTALSELALDPSSLEGAGSVVEIDEHGGVLRERAAWTVRDQLPEPELTVARMAAAVREAHGAGVTSVHDMDGAAAMRVWGRLERERGLSMRVWQCFSDTELDAVADLGLWSGYGSRTLRVGGIKVFADGTLGSGTAWMHGDNADTGTVLTDRNALSLLTRRAAEAGLPLLVHAIGDAANTAVIDAFAENADLIATLDSPCRIEHAQLVRPDDIERCAELNVAASMQPSHLLTDQSTADRHWGERCVNAFPLNSFEAAGVPILLGSDAPIEPLEPLRGIATAVLRAAEGDEPWIADQRISMEQALVASTRSPAQATGAGGWLGQLSPGYEADLVVLDGDPLTSDPHRLGVVATMVGGRWVHGRSAL